MKKNIVKQLQNNLSFDFIAEQNNIDRSSVIQSFKANSTQIKLDFNNLSDAVSEDLDFAKLSNSFFRWYNMKYLADLLFSKVKQAEDTKDQLLIIKAYKECSDNIKICWDDYEENILKNKHSENDEGYVEKTLKIIKNMYQ